MQHEITETCSCGAQYSRVLECESELTAYSTNQTNNRITAMQEAAVDWRKNHRHEFAPQPAVKDDGTRDPKAFDINGGEFGFGKPNDHPFAPLHVEG